MKCERLTGNWISDSLFFSCSFLYWCSRHSLVAVVTRLWAGWLRNLTWGDPKILGIVKKIYLKYLYKFETLVLFEVLPLRLDAAIPAPLPMLETSSKIFKGNAFHFPAAKLTTYLHLASWVRISGIIRPLLHMIPWCEFIVPNFTMRWINANWIMTDYQHWSHQREAPTITTEFAS